MGFSLALFFETLDELLSDDSRSAEERLAALREEVATSKLYSRESGAL